MLILYDEPFTGLDPISLGVIGQLIRRAERRARRDLDHRHARRAGVARRSSTTSISCRPGAIIARGHARRDPRHRRAVRAPVRARRARRAGSVPLPGARLSRGRELAGLMRGAMLEHCGAASSASATHVIDARLAAGLRGALPRATLCFTRARRCSRFRLTMREIYFAGVLSLIIIMVSGLFVGMVLALQGYDTLQRYGADRVARRAGGAVAGARARARWSPACCSPAAPAAPSPRRSA